MQNIRTITKKYLAFIEERSETISQKCFNTIKINKSSISNRCSYQNKFFRSSMTTLIFSNEESLEQSGLLMKGDNKTIIKASL